MDLLTFSAGWPGHTDINDYADFGGFKWIKIHKSSTATLCASKCVHLFCHVADSNSKRDEAVFYFPLDLKHKFCAHLLSEITEYLL